MKDSSAQSAIYILYVLLIHNVRSTFRHFHYTAYFGNGTKRIWLVCHFDAAFTSKHTLTQAQLHNFVIQLLSPVLRHPISNTFTDIMAHVGINAAIMIYIYFG